MSIEELKKLLSSDQVSNKSEDLLSYSQDWLKQWESHPSYVLFPKNTEELVSIVLWAGKYQKSLIPVGGRTGLSGGAVALNQELIVSFDKMNQILEFHPTEQTVWVSAGCITKDLQDFAKDHGLCFPISFSAEGSSQIGGNIATNVGGVHVVRYGSMRNRVLGLEVVTGQGQVLNLGKGLIKNAVGYNLKDLFIGSEGTLGLVSKALLSLVPIPDNPQVFLISLSKFEDVLSLFKDFKGSLQPLAFEFWTDKALNYVLSHSGQTCPLSQRSAFYVLIELEQKDSERALSLFEKAFEKKRVLDGLLSQNSDQVKMLWSLRENISESLSSYHPYKNDISVCISQLPLFFQELEKLLHKYYPDFENIIFGHVGDGNLHINILKPKSWQKKDFLKECEKVNQILFELVCKYHGSISAEHGVGLLKKSYLDYSCSKEEIEIMKSLKKIFDPKQILNPGKIFDL